MSEPLVSYAPWIVGVMVVGGAIARAVWCLVEWADRQSSAALDAISPKDSTGPDANHPAP